MDFDNVMENFSSSILDATGGYRNGGWRHYPLWFDVAIGNHFSSGGRKGID